MTESERDNRTFIIYRKYICGQSKQDLSKEYAMSIKWISSMIERVEFAIRNVEIIKASKLDLSQ